MEKRIAAIGDSQFSLTRSLYRYHDWLSSNPVVQILCVVYLQLVFIHHRRASSIAVCTLLLPCSTVTSPLFLLHRLVITKPLDSACTPRNRQICVALADAVQLRTATGEVSIWLIVCVDLEYGTWFRPLNLELSCLVSTIVLTLNAALDRLSLSPHVTLVFDDR